MRGARVEGLPATFHWADLQDSSHYVTVGGKKDEELSAPNDGHHQEIHHLTGEGVGARKCQDRREVTEEMVDEVGSAEVEPKYGTGLDQGAQEAADVGSNHHAHTEALGHGGGVEQGAGGGRVAIVRHRRQQEALG